jgi:hypothetical protein
MQRALLVWVGLGSLGLGAFAACLPEVTVDESLGSDTRPLQGGSAGAATGKAPSSAGTGGVAGADTSSAGTGGAAGTDGDTVPPSTAMGGAGGTDGDTTSSSAGAGGSAGASPTSGGSGGSGGSASPPAGLDGGGVATQCPLTTDIEEACGAYCQLYTSTCGDFPAAYDYEEQAGRDCASVCYNAGWPIGSYTEKGSILCRCYHSYLALTEQAPTPHCYHAAQNPTMGGCQPDP